MGPLAQGWRLRCCTASGCRSAGAAALLEALQAARDQGGWPACQALEIKSVGCLRLCGRGPLLACDRLAPAAADSARERSCSPEPPHPELFELYGGLPPQAAARLLARLAGLAASAEPPAPQDSSLPQPDPLAPYRLDPQHPFFRLQCPVVLEGCGLVDPESLDDALAHGAYRQLARVLQQASPEEVREQIRRSGLRGRGGGGYPTGLKWDTVALQPPGPRWVVCNADEGDPGAFMDRSVLEGDPHRLLEGLALAAYAVGAERGFVYVRAEYPLAIERLGLAIQQARRAGWLGRGLAGTSFAFSLELRVGAGAYVCGEETALLASIQGQRGSPRPRPPFPAQQGLWGQPTLINNVETLAAVPAILRRGAGWFASLGTEGSRGTKVFALSGAVRHTGLVEVEMGTPLRTVVETMGGGSADGSPIKAVQTGGPSGGCIPEALLDTPVDYDSLQALGSLMGSGGMVVMGQATAMPAVARHFMRFCVQESCGKCLPCRAGTVQLLQLLDRFAAGQAEAADLPQLESLCRMVKATSLCGLGQAAPNPVLSTLRHFRAEYEAALRPEERP